MKQGTLITKIVMLILFLGVALYLAVYAAKSLSDPFTTAMAYQDTLNDSVEVTGMVVREEQALSGGADIMEVLPEEGVRVARGETVAILYQDSQALERRRQLQELTQKRSQLEYALNHGSSLGDAAKLEQQIIASLLELRASTAGGDLSALESNALSLRTQVLQREFAYSASGDSAAALTEAVQELDAEIAALDSQISGITTSIYAPRSGLFSAAADGLEAVLPPDALETMTAAEYKAAAAQAGGELSGAVGKLITGDRWYFVTVVEPSTARRLQAGDSILVGFSHDYTGTVDMRVERVGSEETEGCVVVLSSSRNLKDITLLRTQTVELIFEQFTGIHVSKQALHMETVTLTDSDSGEETQLQILGVYTVVGQRAEFKPVEVVREGKDYYLVSPASDSDYFRVLSAAQAKRRILRAGDEIIVTASGLYDGKVVLE